MTNQKRCLIVVLTVSLAISFLSPLLAVETKGQEIDQWLILGPAKVPLTEKELLGDDKTLLDFKHIAVSDLEPHQGGKVPWTANQVLQWTVLKNPEFAGYETGVLYLATYLEPSRWLKTTLEIHSTNLGAAVFLDGHSIKPSLLSDKITASLELTHEKHLLVLKILLLKGSKLHFKASLVNDEPLQDEKIAISLTPLHRLRPENIINMINVADISISPDGKRVAVSLKQIESKSGKTRQWVEILNTFSGDCIFSSQNFDKLSSFKWMGNSTDFSYVKTEKGKDAIIHYNLNTLQQSVILKDLKNFYEYWWAPDGTFLVYCTFHEDTGGESYKYIKDLPDRAEDSGYRYSMSLYFPFGGSTHRLTGDEQNFQSVAISPDSRSILLIKNDIDYKNRPYNKAIFYLADVGTMTVKSLLESNWLNMDSDSVNWSPDSRQLLFLGGPSAFNGLGINLEKGKIPNDYDIQAYIYNLNARQATAITKEFNPSLNEAYWSSSANYIYFLATDQSDVGVFKYSHRAKNFQRLQTRVEVVDKIAYAAKRNTAVFWGSSAVVPHKLYRLNLSSGKTVLLKDYNKDYFKDVEIGKVTPWNFKTSTGKTIIGRIHYPVDFDPAKKYPCIVYYYGGTSPVTRDFGGRYPKNWYSANGYIVYVLQPTGTVGFGQECSSVHVNDWGVVTSAEIIEGVKQLIKEHHYIDPKRIGAMGASYGGFLTQYLATQTDIFAAFISHAGISSLSSYWGVGDWGYTYSGVASANSFPWNRKDLYVGHSPLFMAERITRPLLLLHGNIDNNVPPGESYQMFAALKLLGKEVELVTFKGQKHFILDYPKRLRWMRTIIAWWDKYLKNQPEHWQHMYKK